jgi:hypothetical protein
MRRRTRRHPLAADVIGNGVDIHGRPILLSRRLV